MIRIVSPHKVLSPRLQMLSPLLPLSLSLLILSGCQHLLPRTNISPDGDADNKVTDTIPKDGDTPSDVRQPLPPIAFYGKDKSPEFRSLCDAQGCENDYQLGIQVLKSLRLKGHFTKVSYDDEQLDYAIHLAVSEIAPDTERRVRAEFVVTWKNVQIAQYTFHSPFDDERRAAENLVSQLIDAARDEGVFSGEYLYQSLAASDYKNQLIYPTQVGDFVYVDQHIYNHPLEGIQLNYVHNMFEFDRYDVFIYPIRRVEWSDVNETLADELSLIAKEIETARKQGVYDSIEIVDSFNTQIKSAGRTLNGKSLSLKASSDGKTFNSYVYLFSQQDKFIKFRISYQTSEQMVSEPNATAFVEAVLPHLKVPAESKFMTRLRDHQKNASL